VHAFEQTSRPVLFEHAHPDFSYWGKGSSLLVATSRSFYWVTASHVLSNSGGEVESLRIFPSDESTVSLPFNKKYSVKTESPDDTHFEDLFMLRIALDEFDRFGDTPLIAQDIDKGILSGDALAIGDEVWVVGYPSESNLIDYESRTIRSSRSIIRGVHLGQSSSVHCHMLKVETSIHLDSYDGLSGSPVFVYQRRMEAEQVVNYPMLVGMLLRGTASSGVAHFLDSAVIAQMISVVEGNAQQLAVA
jgi:hypothetical protein